jgi:glycosyltransferase involved in cell wall biosynthesis
VKACFLLPDLQLSGGVGVVLRHAWHVSRSHPDVEITVLTTLRDAEPAPYGVLADLDVRHVEEVAGGEPFDVAVATWWETAYRLFDVPARRYGYFVQSMEDRFYLGSDPVERAAAALTYDMPVSFITEARWIMDLLGALRPDAECHYVRNGIDKEVFRSPDAIRPSDPSEPLRVLIEGNPEHWLKAVPDALEAVRLARAPLRTTLVSPRPLEPDVDYGVDRAIGPLDEAGFVGELAEADVVLKLSRVEGMFGPPLEGFHLGATCVVTPVTGHDEYVVHLHNGVVSDFDDLPGVARWLDLLAADREFLNELRANALETARAWPSWEDTSAEMAAALRAIAASAPGDPVTSARHIMRHAWSAAEAQRAEMDRRRVSENYMTEQLEVFRASRAFRVASTMQRTKKRLSLGRRK